MESNEFAQVPEHVRTLIDTLGFLQDLPDDIRAVLAPATEGHCMTCNAELGEEVVLFVNRRGICAAYCGGACAQDMAVLGWLQEQHDDIQDSVRFRGGEADH